MNEMHYCDIMNEPIEIFIKKLKSGRDLSRQIAVYGKNFCVSAKNAFFLLMRNIIRSVVMGNSVYIFVIVLIIDQPLDN